MSPLSMRSAAGPIGSEASANELHYEMKCGNLPRTEQPQRRKVKWCTYRVEPITFAVSKDVRDSRLAGGRCL